MALLPSLPRALGALLLVLVASSTPALAQENVAARQRAEIAINEGRYGEALSVLQPLITNDTRSPQLFVLRARAYEGREEYPRAIADYQRALELDPNHAAAREGMQRARASLTQTTRTDLDGLSRLVAANPNNLPFRLQYADALYEAALYPQAAEQYGAYLERTQGTPDILKRYLISIASYEGDNDKGERVAERYLQFYPTDDDLHMRLGFFRLWQGKYPQAIQAFEQAIRLNPNNREAQQGLEQARAQRQQAAARPADPQRAEPQGSQPSEYPVDALVRDLERDPSQDQKRFQLVRELIRYDRFFEAYDHLLKLAGRYDTTERWLDLFQQIDRGLVRTTGRSPIYPVDRFTYLLRIDPRDADTRYALVDALIEAGRFTEAYDVLTERPYADVADERYKVRLQAIEDVRERMTAERIATLEAQLQQTPGDTEALRELANLYVQRGQTGEALRLYELLLQAGPDRAEVRFEYGRLLLQNGYYGEAREQAARLLEGSPNDADYRRLYAMAAIRSGSVDARAEAYLAALLEADPDDAELLLELSALRLAQGQTEEADNLIRRAYTVASPALQARVEMQSMLTERELIRLEEARELEILNDARRLAAARMYPQALEQYEAYFEARGRRTRGELKEVAQVHTAAGDFVAALSILEALQTQLYEYDVAKEIARNRFYMQDYAGAIQVLEALVQENPGDFEVRMLLSDAYQQLQRYAQARAVYQDAVTASASSELIEERIAVIEASSVTGVASSRPDRGLDYVGIIVPLAEAVIARGSGTSYSRWAQGLMTQVTVPVPAVIYAGLTSHFLSGTRRLIPNSETVTERVNQVYGGGYLDLTPAIRSPRASYTNRISLLAGVFDYEGGRTVPFGELRYWHQEPDVYAASAGIRSTEGAIDLWSPAGGEFALRLTQFDVRASSASVLPDSLMRLSGVVALNVVTDNFGSTNTTAGTNQGTNIQLDASYRIIPYTYLGLSYYQLSYRNTVDIYFSPRNFQTYTAWLEYEREYADAWYLRLRGSLGAVARSNGFIARRLEADLIYRFAPKWAISITSSVGQSTRTLGNESLTVDDVYNTFIFSGQLYWTL